MGGRLQQEAIDDAEHRRVDADAEGDRGDADDREDRDRRSWRAANDASATKAPADSLIPMRTSRY